MSDKTDATLVENATAKPTKANFTKLLSLFIKRDGTARPAPRSIRGKQNFVQLMEKYTSIKSYYERELWRENGGTFCLMIIGEGVSVTISGDTAHQFMAHQPNLLAEIIGAGYDVSYC